MIEVCTDPSFEIVDFIRYAVTDSWMQGERQRNMCLALNQYQYPVDMSDFPDWNVENHLIFAHYKTNAPDKSGNIGRPHMPCAALCYTINDKSDRSWNLFGLTKAQGLIQVIGFGGNGTGGGRAVMLKLQEIAIENELPIFINATPKSAPFYEKMGFQTHTNNRINTRSLQKVWGSQYLKT